MTKEELFTELMNCRNELCLKCGAYRDSHLGACDGCRYNFENMAKWDTIEERPTGGRVVPDVLQGWRYEERSVGHWVSKCEKYYDGITCSVCGELLPYSDEYLYITDYCPNCGAKMEEE